ncbi:MAG TPA: DNA translocase FtsK [bacterium]|nr:DNA translocase FtsK [bacterium]
MSTPIYLAIAILVIILLVILFLLKKLNNKINDIALKTDFFDQKLDSSNETILFKMNQQYTELMTSIKKPNEEPQDNRSDEDLYKQAKKLVIEFGKASASFIQRKLTLGYAKSAELLDKMEEEGIVGRSKGINPREILKK